MSCIFCGSFCHVSEYCEDYVTDIARKERIRSHNLETKGKMICRCCLKTNCDSALSGICNSVKKCYSCYITDRHHTVYCPDRFKTPKLFIPNINQDLLQRFLGMFNAYEKVLLAFQSPTIFNKRLLCPLTIYQILNIEQEEMEYEGNNIFICKRIYFYDNRWNSKICQNFFEQIASETWTFFAENISIHYYKLLNVDLSLLLSWRTKILNLEKIKIPLKSDEIFKKAPNLEDFTLSSVICNEEAIKYLKIKYEDNFKKLKIIVLPEFDIELLPIIIRNVRPMAEIYLFIDYDSYSPGHARRSFSKNLAKHFKCIPEKSTNDKRYLSISLQAQSAVGYMGLFVLSENLLSENCE